MVGGSSWKWFPCKACRGLCSCSDQRVTSGSCMLSLLDSAAFFDDSFGPFQPGFCLDWGLQTQSCWLGCFCETGESQIHLPNNPCLARLLSQPSCLDPFSGARCHVATGFLLLGWHHQVRRGIQRAFACPVFSPQSFSTIVAARQCMHQIKFCLLSTEHCPNNFDRQPQSLSCWSV